MRREQPLKKKLLTGAQRKALEARVRVQESKLKQQIRDRVQSEPVPAEVVKARKIVEDYEQRREELQDRLELSVTRMVKQVTGNLLFDPVDSCLLQVEEFENCKAPRLT